LTSIPTEAAPPFAIFDKVGTTDADFLMLSVTPLVIAGKKNGVTSAKPPIVEVPTLRLRSGQAPSKIAKGGAASVIMVRTKTKVGQPPSWTVTTRDSSGLSPAPTRTNLRKASEIARLAEPLSP
jgi:hypothetical protein